MNTVLSDKEPLDESMKKDKIVLKRDPNINVYAQEEVP